VIWIVTLVCCILAVEILLRSSLFKRMKYLIYVCGKASRIIVSKRISDHWKEKVLPEYARRIFKGSLFLFMSLVVILLPFIIAMLVLIPFGIKLHYFLTSPIGLSGTTLMALTYGFTRARYGKK